MQEFMEDYVDAYRPPGTHSGKLENIIKHARHRLLTDIPKVYSMIPKESLLHLQITTLVDEMKTFAIKPPNLYEILQFRSRLDNIAEEREVELEKELIEDYKNSLPHDPTVLTYSA